MINPKLLRVAIAPCSFKLAFSEDSLGRVPIQFYLLFERVHVSFSTILRASSILLELFDLIVAVSDKDLQRGAIEPAR